MIKMIRADDNLLHGSVAVSWVRNLRLHQIIVADDQASEDEFTRMTLGLSKPSGVLLQILSVNEAKKVVQRIQPELNTLIIVGNLRNAKALLDKLPSVKQLNIGLMRTAKPVLTYGLMNLNTTDIEICNELIQKGIEVEYRIHYSDDPVLVVDLLKRNMLEK